MIGDSCANTTGFTFLLQIGSGKTDISLVLNIDKILLLSYVFGPQLEQSITELRQKGNLRYVSRNWDMYFKPECAIVYTEKNRK